MERNPEGSRTPLLRLYCEFITTQLLGEFDLTTFTHLSRPALSQMVAGRARRARAYADMASDFLPE
jgi:hypothetical protein